MKNKFYVIVVIFPGGNFPGDNFWRKKKFSTTNVNWKSGLNEKYFLATMFQSKILIKTRKPDTSSFRSFSENLKDITISGSLTDSP